MSTCNPFTLNNVMFLIVCFEHVFVQAHFVHKILAVFLDENMSPVFLPKTLPCLISFSLETHTCKVNFEFSMGFIRLFCTTISHIINIKRSVHTTKSMCN